MKKSSDSLKFSVYEIEGFPMPGSHGKCIRIKCFLVKTPAGQSINISYLPGKNQGFILLNNSLIASEFAFNLPSLNPNVNSAFPSFIC